MARSDLEVLASIPLFEGLSKKELRRVLAESQEERFASGREIVSEGSPGGRFFVITSGRAAVTRRGRKLGSLRAGDYFGEISILDKGTRSATVKAETDVYARAISSWNFLSLLEEEWPMAKKILVALARMIRELEASPTH